MNENVQVKSIVKILQNAIKDNWLSEPEDVKKLKLGSVKGAYEHISNAILYAESETREMVEYLWYIKIMTEKEEIGFNVAKVITSKILDSKQDKWIKWYNFEKVSVIIKKAVIGINETKSKDEFLSILEPLQIFIGKINFWLDSLVPWLSIASVFDYTLLNR